MMMSRRLYDLISLCTAIIILILCTTVCGNNYSKAGDDDEVAAVGFDENYVIDWGAQQFTFLHQKRQLQIQIDPTSGGGFRSKDAYVSGYFQISLKIPANATGIATTFYLTSILDNAVGGNHDELDFELLGGNGCHYKLNTNVFTQDSGHREQQFNLWFDPTFDFHHYAILWNQKQIVFLIDNIPIRVFKNNETIGVKYPKLPMYVHASLWNASQWLGPTDWSRGPFYASYRGFEVCAYPNYNGSQNCTSWQEEPWNAPIDWEPTQEQQLIYKLIKNRYIVYDYCKSDFGNHFPECMSN